jgi:hypothetical protein
VPILHDATESGQGSLGLGAFLGPSPVADSRTSGSSSRVTFPDTLRRQSSVRLVSRLEARRVEPGVGGASVSRRINISLFDAQRRLAEEWAIWSTWLGESSLCLNPLTTTLDDAKWIPSHRV